MGQIPFASQRRTRDRQTGSPSVLVRKPFDQSMYDSDDPAKHLVLDWLMSQGFYGDINPDQYGIDLVGDYSGVPYGIEVEIKHNWKGDQFPYSTVHFSARKLKFLKTPAEVVFIMLNHERTHALTVGKKSLESAIIVTKDTIYTDNEQFIEVPLAECTINIIHINKGEQDDNRTEL